MTQRNSNDSIFTCPRCSGSYSLYNSRLEGLLPRSFVQWFLIERGMKAFLWFFLIIGDVVLITFRGIRCPRCGRLGYREMPKSVRSSYVIMVILVIAVAITILVIAVSVPK